MYLCIRSDRHANLHLLFVTNEHTMAKHVKFSECQVVFDIPSENAGRHIRDCAKHIPCEIKFVSSEVKKRRVDSYNKAKGKLDELEVKLKTCLRAMSQVHCHLKDYLFYKEQIEEILFHMELWTMRMNLVK
ncbi:hypothetical protein ATCVNEJV3_693R [Acanthocystis turfacea Chlorella virus NE-JV-3]|nr:hypothetical protein ATCVNEJV3_693R [Acanthocystis turfacea Chlorella virus NE-JV-3]